MSSMVAKRQYLFLKLLSHNGIRLFATIACLFEPGGCSFTRLQLTP